MKNIISLGITALLIASSGMFSACSEFEPTGLPYVPELPVATDVQATVAGRTVTVTWTLPANDNIEGVKLIPNGNADAAVVVAGRATSYSFKGQPSDSECFYTVKVLYKDNYVSEGSTVKIKIPFVAAKMAYVLTAPSVDQLPDDDEIAAATWFKNQENAEFVTPSEIASLDPDIYAVVWIEIDRENLPYGWENLPGGIADEATIDALKEYSRNGGSIYLSNMATQLTAPLGFVPDNMAPSIFGNGAGGEGGDVWVINAYLGWDFKDRPEETQGFYDRTGHEIFKDLTFEDPNNYGYDNLPLIGPGHREDHNCMWDCNIYGRGAEVDVIRNFEVTTNSLVLATWGHVRDHCVAGLVDFFSTPEHGRCVANGFAAYEWHQNSGDNPYQHNVEQLTLNILNYLK